MSPFIRASAITLTACGFASLAMAQTQAPAVETLNPDTVFSSSRNDVSPALRGMTPIPVSKERHGRPVREHRIPFDEVAEVSVDSLLGVGRLASQAANKERDAKLLAPTIQHFDGLGQGFVGPAGTMEVNSVPPDTTGAVGGTQFVQWVNTSFAVFDKSTKAPVYGPADGKTLWQGFGGACESHNDGDPIAQYDKLARRWVLTQFALLGTKFLQCIAVSTSDDALGTFNRYEFEYSSLNDFPKLSVWPDGYYVTYNMFRFGIVYQGARVCALDRAKMLVGQPATQQCVQMGSQFGSMLASDLDGSPAASAQPNFIVALATNSLNLWQYKVDWANAANSTMTGPFNLPVAAYSRACGNGNCVNQPGTSNTLDSLSDRLNFRAAYRQFDDHDSMVLTHAVSTGSGAGSKAALRWYELRGLAGGSPTVAQQGTFAPTADLHRWMGSIAQDKKGNIVVGYNTAGASQFASLNVAVHLAKDPLGVMARESLIVAGTGAQTGNLTRWGDYSQTTIDPDDDCTFWTTGEYLKQDGSYNWSTRIAAAKLPSCR